jgi:hypothetical protein
MLLNNLLWGFLVAADWILIELLIPRPLWMDMSSFLIQ